MNRTHLRTTVLLSALLLLATIFAALPAGAAVGQGREYFMLSFQTGGYQYEDVLTSLYDYALFSGVMFNDGKDFSTSSPSKDSLLSQLDTFKTTPDADDITFFHFIGTGYLKDGVAGIHLNGGEELPLTDLSAALSELPGTVCLLLDIKAAGLLPASFNQKFGLAFSSNKFQYLSACSATDAAFGGAQIPRATRILLTGFGMNVSTRLMKSKNWPADFNKNYAVSLKEAASYLRSKSKKLKAADFSLTYRSAGSGPNLFAYTGVSSLTLTVPSGVSTRDSSVELQYAYTPANADVFNPRLASSAPKIASVLTPPNGYWLTINRAGTTLLTARSGLYPYPKSNSKLTVSPVHTESIDMVVDFKTVNDQTIEQKALTDFQATAYVNPVDSDYQEIQWKSSNKKVASVEGDKNTSGRAGYIRCKNYGTTKITAYTKDGVQGSFTLNIPSVEIQGIYPMDDLKLLPGMKWQHGTCTYPEGTVSKIAYKSSKPSIASVSSIGRISAKKYGDAVITATCVQNPKFKITYTIHVVPNACTWAAPVASTLGDGVHYAPKKLSFSGKWLVGTVYVINNTDEPFISGGPLMVGAMDNIHGPGEQFGIYIKKLTPPVPVPARGIGTYTFKIDKSSKIGGVLGKKLSSYILPWEQLLPYVSKP